MTEPLKLFQSGSNLCCFASLKKWLNWQGRSHIMITLQRTGLFDLLRICWIEYLHSVCSTVSISYSNSFRKNWFFSKQCFKRRIVRGCYLRRRAWFEVFQEYPMLSCDMRSLSTSRFCKNLSANCFGTSLPPAKISAVERIVVMFDNIK